MQNSARNQKVPLVATAISLLLLLNASVDNFKKKNPKKYLVLLINISRGEKTRTKDEKSSTI